MYGIAKGCRVAAFILLALFLLTSCDLLSREKYELAHTDMQEYQKLDWEKDSTVLVMVYNGECSTRPLTLKKGKYVLQLKAMGVIDKEKQFPHSVISIGRYVLKDFSMPDTDSTYELRFELPEAVDGPLKLALDNDYDSSANYMNIRITYPIILKSF